MYQQWMNSFISCQSGTADVYLESLDLWPLLNSWWILLSWTQHLSCHSAVNTVHLTLIIWVFPSNWTRNRSIILNLIRLKQRLHLQQQMFYKQYLFLKSTFKNVPIAYSRYKLLFLEMFLNSPWKFYGSKDYF